MHWKKNRKVNPAAGKQIIQSDRCPGCGVEIQFCYGEHGQTCHECKKARIEDAAEVRRDRRGGA